MSAKKMRPEQIAQIAAMMQLYDSKFTTDFVGQHYRLTEELADKLIDKLKRSELEIIAEGQIAMPNQIYSLNGYYKIEDVVANDLGWHSRPSAHYVKLANQLKASSYFDGEIFIQKLPAVPDQNSWAHGRSIMGNLMLAASPGTELAFYYQPKLDQPGTIKLHRKLAEFLHYDLH